MISKSNLFLKEFTKELILNTKVLFPERFQQKVIISSVMPQIKIKEASKQSNIAISIKPAQIQIPAAISNLKPSAGIVSRVIPRTIVISSTSAVNAGFIPVGNAFNLAKINDLVRDSSINSIESIGVGKPILIRKMRGGPSIATKIMLTKEDINQILNSFSLQARIPRIGGIFRAIVGNLLITAVDSEFGGGPKFIISKVA